MRTLSIVLIAALLVGCEGKEQRAARLRQQLDVAGADVTVWEIRSRDATGDSVKITRDSLRAAQTRLDLAQREWNQFMR